MQDLFNPRSVALVGATPRRGSVGRGLAENLLKGCPRQRQIFFVNPKRKKILGQKVYPSLLDLPAASLDLVVIAIPAPFVLAVAREAAEKKAKNLIVISAGFAEAGREGQKRQAALVALCQRHNIRLIGPNCLGVLAKSSNLNASFAPDLPPGGNIAFLSQSGAIIDALLDQSQQDNFPLEKVVSLGNEAACEASDFLLGLADDPQTKVFALYLEGVKEGRKFVRALKKVTARKPVIILKSGQTSAGQAAAASHTASLAGSYEIFRAAARQGNAFVVKTLSELLFLAKSFSYFPKPARGKLAIITNGGGVGVLTADYCAALKVPLAPLKKEIAQKMKKSGVMNPAFAPRNPLDIIGDALADRYQVALENWLADSAVGGALVLLTPQTMTQPLQTAKILGEMKKKFPHKPLAAVFLGGEQVEAGRQFLARCQIPCFTEPYFAVQAFQYLLAAAA